MREMTREMRQMDLSEAGAVKSSSSEILEKLGGN
jgi:hypothetical protein